MSSHWNESNSDHNWTKFEISCRIIYEKIQTLEH